MATKRPPKVTTNMREFVHGYLIACASVIREFDQPTMAYEILCEVGCCTLGDLKDKGKGLMEFDLKPLRKCIKQEAPHGK